MVTETAEFANRILEYVIIPLVSLAGVVLNLGAFCLVLMSRLDECFHMFALLLPLSNILPILISLLFYHGIFDWSSANDFTAQLSLFSIHWSIFSAHMILVVLIGDRALSLRFPVYHGVSLNSSLKYPIKATVVCYTVAGCLFSTDFVFFGIDLRYGNVGFSNVVRGTILERFYTTYAFLLCGAVPLASIVFFQIYIKHKKIRKQLNNQNNDLSEEYEVMEQISAMAGIYNLLIVGGQVFVSGHIYLHYLDNYKGDEYYRQLSSLCVNISKLFFIFNFSLCFIVYAKSEHLFWKEFEKVLNYVLKNKKMTRILSKREQKLVTIDENSNENEDQSVRSRKMTLHTAPENIQSLNTQSLYEVV